jgi:hypothetical protein
MNVIKSAILTEKNCGILFGNLKTDFAKFWSRKVEI